MFLPYNIRSQLIQCIGLCFHYKDNVQAFFLSCGVERNLASRDKELAKFKWATALLNSLDEIDGGDIIQKRLITELCKFKDLPDKDAPNREAGLSALRKLKELAYENQMEIKEVKDNQNSRTSLNEEKQKIAKDRARLLQGLNLKFSDALSSTNRQKAGYELEEILELLFPLFELEYKKSYKIESQQIDGHFKFEGFDYLVEAKWTKDMPNEAIIGGFKRKIDTKLESTRGIFISINGFRTEVVKSFEGVGNNIIFFDGQDIQFVLEGHIDLRELLHMKIEKAAQEGIAYVSVTSLLE